MIAIAWQTMRARLPGLVGAMVALALGVAFFGAAASLLVAGPGAPAAVRAAVQQSGSLLVMLAAIGAFVTVFVVSGTFAFSVAQRRRELATMRLIGATGAQVRRMVLAEAAFTALLAAAAGAVLAAPMTKLVAALLRARALLPAGFRPGVSPGADLLAFAGGLAIGVAAAAIAARRAGRVSPAAAMRESRLADRPIGRMRWAGGLLALACGAAMPVLLPMVPPDGRMPLAMFVALPLVLGFALLAPAFSGRLGALASRPLTACTRGTGMLAGANLRQAARRTASTAAPVLVTVGLTGALLGGITLLSQAIDAGARQVWRSDLVVSPGANASRVAALPGVRAAVPVVESATTVVANRTTRTVGAFGVGSAGVRQVLDLGRVQGDLGRLGTDGVAADRSQAAAFGWRLGGPVRLAGRTLTLTAVYDGAPLSSAVLVPARLVNGRPSVHVRLAPGADRRAVAAEIVRHDAGVRVAGTAQAVAAAGHARQEGMRIGALAIAEFAGAYTLIAVANTAALAFAARGAEFARLIRLGVRRAQVLRMVLWEALCTAVTGIVLGGAVAAIALVSLRQVLARLGLSSLPGPAWGELAVVPVVCLVVVVGASLAAAAPLSRYRDSSRR